MTESLPAACYMTDAQIAAEYARLDELWAIRLEDEDGHGGSPGEWLWERFGELDTECKRRGIVPPGYCPPEMPRAAP